MSKVGSKTQEKKYDDGEREYSDAGPLFPGDHRSDDQEEEEARYHQLAGFQVGYGGDKQGQGKDNGNGEGNIVFFKVDPEIYNDDRDSDQGKKQGYMCHRNNEPDDDPTDERDQEEVAAE